jgi:hypothetical protein
LYRTFRIGDAVFITRLEIIVPGELKPEIEGGGFGKFDGLHKPVDLIFLVVQAEGSQSLKHNWETMGRVGLCLPAIGRKKVSESHILQDGESLKHFQKLCNGRTTGTIATTGEVIFQVKAS